MYPTVLDEQESRRLKSCRDSFLNLGFEIGRLKTGTPPRVNAHTVNFDAMEIQPGDAQPRPFSFSTEQITQPQMPCHLTHTNEKNASDCP